MLLALTYLTRHYAKRVDKLLERMDFNKRYTEACVCVRVSMRQQKTACRQSRSDWRIMFECHVQVPLFHLNVVILSS